MNKKGSDRLCLYHVARRFSDYFCQPIRRIGRVRYVSVGCRSANGLDHCSFYMKLECIGNEPRTNFVAIGEPLACYF